MPATRLTVFHFVVRRFGRLRRYSVLVQAFDLFLLILTAATEPSVLTVIQKLTREAKTWPGVIVSRHRLGGRQFDHHGVELGHVHSNGILDVRLTRTEHDDVLGRGLAGPHHVAPGSTWVTLVIERSGQAEAAAALLAIPFNRLRKGQVLEQPSEEEG